jgi:predicted RNA methylase
MAQNRSSAVMAQRKEAHDSLDDFPTPPWATRALLRHVLALVVTSGKTMPKARVWDPACNRGFMARPLAESFGSVAASDIHDYGFSGHQKTVDFLWPDSEQGLGEVDWVITNPPFRLADQFIERAFDLNLEGFAFLMRTAFLEGDGRHTRIFSRFAPTVVAQFSERVVMHKGKIVDPNIAVPVEDKKSGETVMRKPSTATSYMWFAWLNGRKFNTTSELVWIPRCRQELEREGDYVI